MTDLADTPITARSATSRPLSGPGQVDASDISPRGHALRAGSALAAAMGVGRFVYTPILPLMHTQAGLSAGSGADLATANYLGYLVGALAGILAPALVRSRALLHACLAALAVSLVAMPATHSTAAWAVLRLTAGAASALVFVIAVSSLLGHLRDHPSHLTGWAFGGVGAGIALSGLLVLVLRSVADWRAAWWAAAGLTAVFAAASWNLLPAPAPAPRNEAGRPATGTHRGFTVLLTAYTLEGIGYIIAGTFLVSAIDQSAPGWAGSSAWILAGLAAVPSSALWIRLAHRWSHPALLATALTVQAVGIALPALTGSVTSALISALLFGGTFIGISTLALASGARMRHPRSVALLTAGYSVGQLLGPPVVAPLLHHGYHQALLLAAAIVLVAALAAAALCLGDPNAPSSVGS